MTRWTAEHADELLGLQTGQFAVGPTESAHPDELSIHWHIAKELQTPGLRLKFVERLGLTSLLTLIRCQSSAASSTENSKCGMRRLENWPSSSGEMQALTCHNDATQCSTMLRTLQRTRGQKPRHPIPTMIQAAPVGRSSRSWSQCQFHHLAPRFPRSRVLGVALMASSSWSETVTAMCLFRCVQWGEVTHTLGPHGWCFLYSVQQGE